MIPSGGHTRWFCGILMLALLGAMAETAYGSEKARVVILADGTLDFLVEGEVIARNLEANRVHTFRVSLQEHDVIALRWRPRGGHEDSDGLLVIAQTPDGRKVFASGHGWRCSHNETRSWAMRKRVATPPWQEARLVEGGPVARLADRFPPVRAITARSSPAYLRGVLRWDKTDSSLDVKAFAEQWNAILEQEREAYFSLKSIRPGRIRIYYEGDLYPLETLPKRKCLKARDYLEAALEQPQRFSVPGGEKAIRKMLRGLRQAIGSNRNRSQAFEWEVLCILATRVALRWKDKDGNRYHFASRIQDPELWRRSINREMRLLSDIVFEKSWGRINIVGDTVVSSAPVTELKGAPGRYWFSGECVRPVIGNTLRPGQARSVFVWIPKDGRGRFPPLLGTATTARATDITKGAILTVVPTSRERLTRAGGWSSRYGGGLLHEFWHNVEKAIKHTLRYEGFVPSNHRAGDFRMLKAEIREQGLPQPDVQYDELLGLWPTGRMCRRLAARP